MEIARASLWYILARRGQYIGGCVAQSQQNPPVLPHSRKTRSRRTTALRQETTYMLCILYIYNISINLNYTYVTYIILCTHTCVYYITPPRVLPVVKYYCLLFTPPPLLAVRFTSEFYWMPYDRVMPVRVSSHTISDEIDYKIGYFGGNISDDY